MNTNATATANTAATVTANASHATATAQASSVAATAVAFNATATVQAQAAATATANAIVTGPPIGFSVTTLQSGQVIHNTDIPLTIKGTYSSEGSGHVWVVLVDNFGNHFLQTPSVRFNGDGTWTATNIRPAAGITEVDFVYVTAAGNAVFQQMVAKGSFGAFATLPADSKTLQSISIAVG